MTADIRSLLTEAHRNAATNPAAALDALALLRSSDLAFSDYVAACRVCQQVPLATRQARAVMSAKLAFIGNNTPTYTASAAVFELGPRIAAEAWEGGFETWAADLSVAGSALQRFEPDVIVVHLCSLGLTTAGVRLDPAPMEQLETALRAHASRSAARLIVVLPEPLAECTGGATAADRWYHATVDQFRDLVARLVTDRVPAVAVDPAAVLTGAPSGWAAARYWAQGKYPMHPSACAALGRRLATTIEALMMPRVKAIAVDCDNTLWGGEVGEVGAAGVNLSVFDTGAGYLRLQRILKEAVENGIVLIALSKNELAIVREVFEQRSEMLLSLEDFSALAVNWSPKPENLQRAARELNIGLDSVLLLDDSPFEREQMRAVCPQVVVLDLPQDADEYAAFLARTGLLDRPILTEEDLRRRNLYADDRQRTAACPAEMSLEEFLRSLELRLVAQPIAADNLTRVTQLLAKTNQFNLTTRRHGVERVSSLAADRSVYAYCFQLIDRFGDAGIVGVLIAVAAGEELAIDTLLMSCRAFGRTAERGMVEHLRRWAVDAGFHAITGEYRPTVKNAPIARFLPDLGFEPVGRSADGARYRYDATAGPFAGVLVELVDLSAVERRQ